MKKNKMVAVCMVAMATTGWLVMGCSSKMDEPPIVEVESVTLSETSLKLEIGETRKFTATIMPSNANDKTVTWSSSNNDVATVSEYGVVTAVGAGMAIITAKAGLKEGKCEVTVHAHSYSEGKCVVCGAYLKIEGCQIGYGGVLTRYNGNEATVVIPDGVTSIGYDAFYECTSLASVTICDGVTSIWLDAFYGCASLTSMTIPASVTSILPGAFSGCTSLTEIQFEGTKEQWSAIAGSDDIGISGIICSDGVIGILGVPAYLKVSGTEVTGYTGKIPAAVVIPDGVTKIGSEAFYKCENLAELTIPASVKSIGMGAFAKCNNLKKVIYNGTLAQWCGIDRGDFYAIPLWCGNSVLYIGGEELTVADIPDGVTEIKDYAFLNCKSLTNVTISDSVTCIGNYAFQGCVGLTSMNIPASVTSIGNNVFVDCSNLASITVDDDNPSYSIQDGILYNKDKTSLLYVPQDIMGNIAILDSVTYIAENAFYACKYLTSVTIPDSVTCIGNYAFQGCVGLTSMNIPASVTNIGNGAFSGCTNLWKMTLPFVGSCLGYIFGGTDNTAVPYSLEVVIILDGITSIGENAFNGCSYLRSVTIPDSVTSIAKGAFSGCTNLWKMTLPFAGATKNGTSNTHFDYIFGGTTNSVTGKPTNTLVPSLLKVITITGSIGDYAFYGCKGLTSVTIGDGVSSIGNYAFRDCSGLTRLVLPNSVTFICERAFNMCASLKTVTMTASFRSIGDSAFSGCMDLMEIVFKGTPEQWKLIYKGSYWDYSTGGIHGQIVGTEQRGYTITYEY